MPATTAPTTMKAIVIKEPYKVVLEDRPVPELKSESDVILKVDTAGICGSDLHIYRGHQPGPYNFIIGHEAVGHLSKVGKDVKNFKVGDKVIVPFSTSCGKCFYCQKGYTSRCAKGDLFGCAKTDGAQAEYIVVSNADGCLLPAPKDVPDDLLILMSDILPTGYYVARNAKRLADEGGAAGGPAEDVKGQTIKKGGVAVVIGCGPVGLCAISSAVTMFDKVFATDLSAERLESAKRHGAIALPASELKQAILDATEGRGADAAMEVVGHPEPLHMAMDLVRPFGCVSSCGVHTHNIDIAGSTLYGKNLRFQFGRCSVPTFYPGALEILRHNQELFSHFIEHKISFDQVPEYYVLFEKNKVGKTVIELGN